MRSPRGVTFPSEGKGDGKVRPSGREDPPQGNALPLRPCFLRQGRGMPLLSPDADGCKNAGVSGNGEVETGSFVKRKAIVFYFEYRAGIVFRKTIEQHPRGSGTEVSASMARDDCIVVTQRISPARSRGTDSSGSRGGAGATNEGKQKAFVPPPAGRAGRVPREDFEGSSHSPPAGFASRGRVVSPRRGTRRPPLGASGALPPRFARLRGRGLPRFCRLHHVGPLRHGIGTSCTKHRIPRFFTSVFPGLLARHKDSSASRPARVPRFESRLSCPARHACRNSRIRPARVPRNHFPRCKPRALPEIKDNRFPLHKHPVSTYPLPLL